MTHQKLDRGGLPLVLSQTFRAIIHSRMKVGLDKYATQYPHADILLFEPAREDVDMFFARIFSYAQRRRLCALAFDSTRRYLQDNAQRLAPDSRGMACACVRNALHRPSATSPMH